ncbi:hypothetical protein [Pseudomonas sp. NA-150]|uniref:hypothetical protein n=1 Tax=Pseudomonas sp. NA-150 TaxID=3367525 RepID=UPI0037C8C86B
MSLLVGIAAGLLSLTMALSGRSEISEDGVALVVVAGGVVCAVSSWAFRRLIPTAHRHSCQKIGCCVGVSGLA